MHGLPPQFRRTRVLRTAAVLVLGTGLALAPALPATAALTNPGFESDLAGWAALNGSAVAVSTDAPHTGTKAAAVSRKATNGAAGITDSPNAFTSLAGGTECRATAWVKGPAGATVSVKWFALNGTSTVQSKGVTVTFTGAWQQTSAAVLTVPSTASTADLRITAPAFPAGQTWFLDDVTAACDAGTQPPPPPTGLAGHWAFDEVGNPPATARDDSGNANNGATFNVRGDGSGYFFNGTNSRVVVPDDATLDPVGRDFSFGVTLAMDTPPQVGETYDILRKGVRALPTGYYKLEIKRASAKAVAGCVFKDANKVIGAVRAGTSLADGRNHTVVCRRTGNTVAILVDGAVKVSKTLAGFGTISNDASLAFGAKAEDTATTGFDWYLGELSDAFVRIG